MVIQAKYLHTSKMHNMESPRIIVEKFLEYYNPKSVVDFGCGLGTFLKAFKEKGVVEVLGLDGEWVNRALLNNYLDTNEFLEVNLETKIDLKKKYDLAVSLEVAEHLCKEKAALFVQNLVNASDVILFSAAIPFQGGQNHINEQWVEFWQDKFSKHNYVFNDIIRRDLWNNKEVKWWYKQNIFIITSNEKEFKQSDVSKTIEILDYIHPEHYLLKAKEHIDFRLGKSRTKEYFKLLIKSILYDFKILKR
jgi:SAM-dependent methyltransferase